MTRKRGGQPGNQNGVKAKIWEQAIHRHLAKRPKDLEEAADALFAAAKAGDISAIKEIGDRLDGKPHQTQSVDATLTGKLVQRVERVIIDPKS